MTSARRPVWLPRVVDTEGEPPNLTWLHDLANSVAHAVHGLEHESASAWPHPPVPPARIYVMCQHGMNRSGLVTGLILRAIGVNVDDAWPTSRASRAPSIIRRPVRLLKFRTAAAS
jgi:hypothetical protein